MIIQIPDFCLVVLIGASGAGKSTFARKHFKSTEIVSSDECRAIVSNDENNQDASTDAFDLLHFIVEKRLKRGLLTVIDATNVQAFARKTYINLARRYHCDMVALVFDMHEDILAERLWLRRDRNFGDYVLRNHQRALADTLPRLSREGFHLLHVFDTPEAVAEVEIRRHHLPNNRKDEPGPFDIIGDIHGCYEELIELLQKLNYKLGADEKGPFALPPAGRKTIFLGDLVDRGPDSPAVLRLVMRMVADNLALCVPGNHDDRLMRKLNGNNVSITHGLAETLMQLEAEPPAFHLQVREFLRTLPDHYVLDGGRLVVVHAGLKEALQGRQSGTVRSFSLFGDTTGKTDSAGYPERRDWAATYQGSAKVVFGHTPVAEPREVNNTLNIDTGCVYGGKLTALCYPENQLVQVAARQIYATSARFQSDLH